MSDATDAGLIPRQKDPRTETAAHAWWSSLLENPMREEYRRVSQGHKESDN